MTLEADNVFEQFEQERDEIDQYKREAAVFFHEHEGDLFERNEAVSELSDHLDCDAGVATELVSHLVSDHVDPIVQVRLRGQMYVGVVEFVEGDGWYGYLGFDDVKQKRKRVVCAQCVHNATYVEEVKHATAGLRSFSDNPDADYDELSARVEEHYEQDHDGIKPEEVETGATLVSGTTINSNTALHGGNLSSFGVTSFSVGTTSDGDFLKNTGGSLSGSALASEFATENGSFNFTSGGTSTQTLSNSYDPDAFIPVGMGRLNKLDTDTNDDNTRIGVWISAVNTTGGNVDSIDVSYAYDGGDFGGGLPDSTAYWRVMGITV